MIFSHSPRFTAGVGFYFLLVCGLLFSGPIFPCSLPRAHRIISLSPALTKILYDLGAEHSLVGQVSPSTEASTEAIPIVASYHGIDMGRVLQLQPDLVITSGTSVAFEPALAQLKVMGVGVYQAPSQYISDIPITISDLGCFTGQVQRAKALVNHFQYRYRQLKTQFQAKSPVRVFYQLWDQPLTTVGVHSLINQAIEFCGGINVFHTALGDVPEINIEQVLLAQPQVIINSTNSGNNWKKMWYSWPAIPAVAQGHLYRIAPDLLQQATPDFLVGVQELCEDIHAVSP